MVKKAHEFQKETGVFLKLSFLFIVLFRLIQPAAGNAQSLSATIDKSPVAVGEQFQLTFTLNASGTNFTGPPLSDFLILGGPSLSNSMNIINGNVSHSTSYTYFLQAKSEGTFKVAPASIITNGKKLESPPFTITVTKENREGNPQQNNNREGVSAEDIFLRVQVDKTKVYRDQAIVVTYKIYTRVQLVSSYAITKAPALNGFWSQDIMKPQQLEMSATEIINGIQYHVGELKKAILFPQQEGILTIDPMEAEFIVRMQSRQPRSNNPFDFFNDPFFSDPFFGGGMRDVKTAVKSNPVKITVQALPPNAPQIFSGSVGKFNMEASLNKNSVKANDPVTLKVKISGRGNLSLLVPPKINFPSQIEAYDPRVTDNISATSAGLTGSKTFEYVLIPRFKGKYKINPVEFSYYDLEKRNYVTHASKAFTLDVAQGDNDAPAVIGGSKADVQVIGKDIRFIKTGNVASYAYGIIYGGKTFYVLLILPLLLFIFIFFIKRKKDESDKNILLVKSVRAKKMAKKRLAAAKQMLIIKDHVKFYDEIFKALWGYIGDKLGLPSSELSKDAVAASLKVRKVSDASASQLLQTIDYCEFARFASDIGRISADEIYNNAADVIVKLEEEIV